MTQTAPSLDEAAYRRLVEWCARIERRRRMAGPAEHATPAGSVPTQSSTPPRAGTAPARVA